MIEGRVWKFGDHVNTDIIIPGRYLDDYDPKHLAKHVMEDLDCDFAKKVRPGGIVVAGRNFGCGSSREQAPVALKEAGVAAVVARSFARIFFRNAINVGLPVVVCPDASARLETGDVIRVDLAAGRITRNSDGLELRFDPLPVFLLHIVEEGGLAPHVRAQLKRGAGESVKREGVRGCH
jgi:3-isopropylmalate/(R)-2-methylmalate dehydratase small subunit